MPTPSPATAQTTAESLVLSGAWTGGGLGKLQQTLAGLPATPRVDATGIESLDTAGAWVLNKLLTHLRQGGKTVPLEGLHPAFAKLLDVVAEPLAKKKRIAAVKPLSRLGIVGRSAMEGLGQARAMLSFIGEITISFGAGTARPSRWRWRPVLFNIRTAGFDALPIVGLLSFLLGIVIVYQGAGQLKLYGANIYVVDLVGLSMLREFAPLMTAIIIAGRSGSAYAAQIGTMAVTEEIDAMRTLGIEPLDLLVSPKIIALLITLPLLTVFADVLGVLGGMIMAHAQLGVGYGEFLDRFVANISVTACLVGIGKSPVFAVIIAVVGCFQGFQTSGGADSVGRHTTNSVVQSIFLVIVADALFSVAFSMLNL